MSSTLNHTQYLMNLHFFSLDDEAMNSYVALSARDAVDFQNNPERYDNDIVRFNLAKFANADPAIQSTLNATAASQDITSALHQAGLEHDALSADDRRQLKWAKLYVDTFRPEQDFAQLLANAADHLRQRQPDETLDPSILHAITFGNGKAWGKQPDPETTVAMIRDSATATALMDKLEARTNLYFEASGSKLTLQDILSETVARTKAFFSDFEMRDLAKGVAFTTALMMGTSGLGMNHAHAAETPQYSAFSYTMQVDATQGQTYGEVAKQFLDKADLSSAPEDVAVLLQLSKLADSRDEAMAVMSQPVDEPYLNLKVPEQVKLAYYAEAKQQHLAQSLSDRAAASPYDSGANDTREEKLRFSTLLHLRINADQFDYAKVPLTDIGPEYAAMGERINAVNADLERQGIHVPGYGSDVPKDVETRYLVHLHDGLNKQNPRTAVAFEDLGPDIAKMARQMAEEAEPTQSFESPAPGA